eukprot:gb/GECH01009029.1/.p1 GENE.gb/GECH01009029.1/~~gb/GECH01009029.1/.p1  ORF type:complete len:294 (+),score=82.48 gb/GECH01009029.1/:1-882(+)
MWPMIRSVLSLWAVPFAATWILDKIKASNPNLSHNQIDRLDPMIRQALFLLLNGEYQRFKNSLRGIVFLTTSDEQVTIAIDTLIDGVIGLFEDYGVLDVDVHQVLHDLRQSPSTEDHSSSSTSDTSETSELDTILVNDFGVTVDLVRRIPPRAKEPLITTLRGRPQCPITFEDLIDDENGKLVPDVCAILQPRYTTDQSSSNHNSNDNNSNDLNNNTNDFNYDNNSNSNLNSNSNSNSNNTDHQNIEYFPHVFIGAALEEWLTNSPTNPLNRTPVEENNVYILTYPDRNHNNS